MHAGGRFLSCRSVCPCIWRSAVLRKGSFADAFQAHRKTLLLRFGCSSRAGLPGRNVARHWKRRAGKRSPPPFVIWTDAGQRSSGTPDFTQKTAPRFLVWRAFARYTGGICAARWRAAPALSRGAFAPSHAPAFSCPSCAALRRRRPAAICVRCQLICFSARGAPYPAPRFCFARRIRSAAGARLAPSHAPAAFVRHAGLYAKDCALSCLASVCTLYRRHLCHEMARRAGSLMRSVCAADIRP